MRIYFVSVRERVHEPSWLASHLFASPRSMQNSKIINDMKINVQYLNEFDKFGDERTKAVFCAYANRLGKSTAHAYIRTLY